MRLDVTRVDTQEYKFEAWIRLHYSQSVQDGCSNSNPIEWVKLEQWSVNNIPDHDIQLIPSLSAVQACAYQENTSEGISQTIAFQDMTLQVLP